MSDESNEPTNPGSGPEGPRDWKAQVRRAMDQARARSAPMLAKMRESTWGKKIVANLRARFPEKLPENIPLYLKEKVLNFEPMAAAEENNQAPIKAVMIKNPCRDPDGTDIWLGCCNRVGQFIT